MRKRGLAFLLLVLISFTVVGCGGGGGSPQTIVSGTLYPYRVLHASEKHIFASINIYPEGHIWDENFLIMNFSPDDDGNFSFPLKPGVYDIKIKYTTTGPIAGTYYESVELYGVLITAPSTSLGKIEL